MKIILIDTFNGSLISRHNTVKNAVKAQQKHLRAVKRANGENSYLTYAFQREDGTPVDQLEVLDAEAEIAQGF